jgi:hypothetical protein
MRLSTSISFLTIFGLACLLFYATGAPDAAAGKLTFYNSSTNVTTPGVDTTNYILDWFASPDDFFSRSIWMIFLLTFLTTVFVTGIFSGLLRISTTDAVTFSMWPIAVLAYGNFWITTIWVTLTRELNAYMNPGGGFALMPMVLALAFVALPAVQFLMAVQQMWRTGFVNS